MYTGSSLLKDKNSMSCSWCIDVDEHIARVCSKHRIALPWGRGGDYIFIVRKLPNENRLDPNSDSTQSSSLTCYLGVYSKLQTDRIPSSPIMYMGLVLY